MGICVMKLCSTQSGLWTKAMLSGRRRRDLAAGTAWGGVEPLPLFGGLGRGSRRVLGPLFHIPPDHVQRGSAAGWSEIGRRPVRSVCH
jgi:hypothetical protein